MEESSVWWQKVYVSLRCNNNCRKFISNVIVCYCRIARGKKILFQSVLVQQSISLDMCGSQRLVKPKQKKEKERRWGRGQTGFDSTEKVVVEALSGKMQAVKMRWTTSAYWTETEDEKLWLPVRFLNMVIVNVVNSEEISESLVSQCVPGGKYNKP